MNSSVACSPSGSLASRVSDAGSATPLGPWAYNGSKTVYAKPKVGDLHVNTTDYDGDIVIERFGILGYDGCGRARVDWAVPAWDEMGSPDLAGPFDSSATAQVALAKHMRWAA